MEGADARDNMVNYTDINADLLRAIRQHAPEDWKNKTIKDYIDMTSNPKEIAKYLIYVLHDGLSYGNWPWTVVD